MRPRQRRRGSSAAQCVRLSAIALIVSWTGLLYFVWATPPRPASLVPVTPASEFPLRDAAWRAREAARTAAAASAEQRQPSVAKHDADAQLLDTVALHAVHQERDGFAMERDESARFFPHTQAQPTALPITRRSDAHPSPSRHAAALARTTPARQSARARGARERTRFLVDVRPRR